MINFYRTKELITSDDLKEFEQKLNGLRLPEDFKQFMLIYNGGSTRELYSIKIDDHEDEDDIPFDGIDPLRDNTQYGLSLEDSLENRVGVLPETDIYIGSVLGGSLCMSLGAKHGSIYAFYADEERIDIASSFTEFLDRLFLSKDQ
ncbi:SMI1/KNR4 family protein [Aureivirga sp. CE67]|uniref:SMI1/KNR4 family protein n=1 Tax=Aureivirga sp. CE67 TaxID=1788983 RepID=UPI0018C9BC4A|nr:SMI1/KNR4 family protein [Aureivirga sp. CE67]